MKKALRQKFLGPIIKIYWSLVFGSDFFKYSIFGITWLDQLKYTKFKNFTSSSEECCLP